MSEEDTKVIIKQTIDTKTIISLFFFVIIIFSLFRFLSLNISHENSWFYFIVYNKENIIKIKEILMSISIIMLFSFLTLYTICDSLNVTCVLYKRPFFYYILMTLVCFFLLTHFFAIDKSSSIFIYIIAMFVTRKKYVFLYGLSLLIIPIILVDNATQLLFIKWFSFALGSYSIGLVIYRYLISRKPLWTDDMNKNNNQI